MTHPYMDITFVLVSILSVRELTYNSIDVKYYESIITKLELASRLYGSEVELWLCHQKLPLLNAHIWSKCVL